MSREDKLAETITEELQKTQDMSPEQRVTLGKKTAQILVKCTTAEQNIRDASGLSKSISVNDTPFGTGGCGCVFLGSVKMGDVDMPRFVEPFVRQKRADERGLSLADSCADEFVEEVTKEVKGAR